MDIKNAFLPGDLQEEVHMELPLGISLKGQCSKVCRLKKALNGLKQSPQAWFSRFSQAIEKTGYKKCHADHTLFVKRKGTQITNLIVNVDDIVITKNDTDEVKRLKKKTPTF